MARFIKINNDRICNCPIKQLSCVTAKQWIQNQLGVWTFNYEKRDIRDKSIHPATFPINLAKRIIEQFTHEGELVIDPFVGSGTTLLAAQDLKRNAIGFDLKKEYVDLSNSRVKNPLQGNPCKQIAVRADARNISTYIKPNTVKLCFTSPPYANMLNRSRKNKSMRGDERHNEQFMRVEQYSQSKKDLGTLPVEEFEIAIADIFKKMMPIFSEKAHIIVNITDSWIEGKRVPLHISIVRALTSVGYEFRNTIIWDRRNIVNRIGIFGWPSSYITMGTTFEYILDFIIPHVK
jgi:DNA modification methylase